MTQQETIIGIRMETDNFRPLLRREREFYGEKKVKSVFNLDWPFFAVSQELLIDDKMRMADEINVISADNSKGYLIIGASCFVSQHRNVGYIERFVDLKQIYEEAGARIKREFIYDDVGRAGFMWKTLEERR